jgi:hypothetical protein
MLQSAMQPTQGMQGNASMTQGQMPDQSNDSLIAKVTANLRADPNYQPTNPIEASIVKQIRGTDPMQQGQPSLQGLGSLAPSQPMAPSFNPSVAMGPTYFAGMNAPQGYADGGNVGMNLDELPTLNLGSGGQGYSGGSGDILASMDPNDPMVQQFFRPGIEKMRAQYNALYGDGSDNILNTMGPNDPIMQKFLRPGIEKMRAQNKALYGDGPDSILNTIDRNDPIAQKMLIPGIEKIRAQNKAVFGYVKGGYLDGQGDGMSDSIPATIEGKQPARLADGEFVVPADVVSHLGNGSSKAGSKRLYAMLDKVRHARTGNKKQGKQIKPEKYMPA